MNFKRHAVFLIICFLPLLLFACATAIGQGSLIEYPKQLPLPALKTGWQRISIPQAGTIDIPPTMEVKSESYKVLTGLTTNEKQFTIQQRGLNELHPDAHKLYVRVMIDTEISKPDEYDTLYSRWSLTEQELKEISDAMKLQMEHEFSASSTHMLKSLEDNLKQMTEAELRDTIKGTLKENIPDIDLKEMRHKLYEAMKQQMLKSKSLKLIELFPVTVEEINGMRALSRTYRRQLGTNPIVHCDVYSFQNYDRTHTLTMSYRESEKEIWEKDFPAILSSFRIKNIQNPSNNVLVVERNNSSVTTALLGQWKSGATVYKFYSNGTFDMIESSGSKQLAFTVLEGSDEENWIRIDCRMPSGRGHEKLIKFSEDRSEATVRIVMQNIPMKSQWVYQGEIEKSVALDNSSFEVKSNLKTNTSQPFEDDSVPTFIIIILFSFILTWGIGITPPLLIRYAIIKRPLPKKAAIPLVVLFWLINIIIFTALGSQSKTHAALFLVAWASYYILHRKYATWQRKGVQTNDREYLMPKDKDGDPVKSTPHVDQINNNNHEIMPHTVATYVEKELNKSAHLKYKPSVTSESIKNRSNNRTKETTDTPPQEQRIAEEALPKPGLDPIMSGRLEKCANCDRTIGKLEHSYMIKGNIVCVKCYQILSSEHV